MELHYSNLICNLPIPHKMLNKVYSFSGFIVIQKQSFCCVEQSIGKNKTYQ